MLVAIACTHKHCLFYLHATVMGVFQGFGYEHAQAAGLSFGLYFYSKQLGICFCMVQAYVFCIHRVILVLLCML